MRDFKVYTLAHLFFLAWTEKKIIKGRIKQSKKSLVELC